MSHGKCAWHDTAYFCTAVAFSLLLQTRQRTGKTQTQNTNISDQMPSEKVPDELLRAHLIRKMVVRRESHEWFGGLNSGELSEPIKKPRPLNRCQSHDSIQFDDVTEKEIEEAKRPLDNDMRSDLPQSSSEETHRQLNLTRQQYNACVLPSKLIMVRHGQSMGNIKEEMFCTHPDNSIPLTKLGWKQAKMAGKAMKSSILPTNQTIHFVVSPYVRTMETFHGIVSAWCDPAEFNHIDNLEKRKQAWYSRLKELGLTFHEDPRIREMDFGNYQDKKAMQKSKSERHKFGAFYYRFPDGESASDVFDRVSTFLDSLWRSFDLMRYQNYVFVTHGISIRVLLARYFRWSVDQFATLANPRNGEMIILGHDGKGKLCLEGRCELTLKQKEEGEEVPQDGKENATKVTGYTFHKKLRLLPDSWISSRQIRIQPPE